MADDNTYRCLDCKWEGAEVDYEQVDTCMGADSTEMCPECGSINIVPVFTN